MNIYRRYLSAFICILSVVLGFGLPFGTDATAQEKSSGPIVITGDDLEIDSKNKVATYRGNVKVVQGQTTMFSDELEISLDGSGKQLKQAVAIGNVRIVNEELTATGGEGTFYNQEQKIILIDKAKVWQGNNAISAPRIIAYLGQEVLEGYGSGSGERAVMTIYSTGGQLSMPFGKSSGEEDPTNVQDEDPSSNDEVSSDSATDETSATSEEKKSPITIEADTLRLDNSSQQGRFSGDVVAVSDTTQLYADEMIVYIIETPEGENDVERIEIFDNVKIVNATQTVTGDKGYFWNLEQRARIEGAPGEKARIEDSSQNLVLEAPFVTIDLATNKVTAESKLKKDEEGSEEKPAEGETERIRTTFGTDETQSMFGTETSEEAEEEIVRYLVTEKTLTTLKEAEVPDEVLEDLALLQDREFRGEEAFLENLGKRIEADQLDKYKKLLLKHSKVEDSSNEQDLPSVTIQPDALDGTSDTSKN